MACDGAGNVYVTGNTSSFNFPVNAGFDTSLSGVGDAFVTKIADGGTTASITWSTFLGGSGSEFGRAIAADGGGNIYVAGETSAADFAATNGFDATCNGSFSDTFVCKIAGAGASPVLVWSTYLGGGGADVPGGIAVDAGGAVFVAGLTGSSNFPVPNGFDTTAGGQDAYLAKIDQSALPITLAWSTYFGGSDTEACGAMTIDSASNIYLAGYTRSLDFDLTGAFDTTRGGLYDAFVTKIAGSGTPSGTVWSSYLGGSLIPGNDYGYGLATDDQGNLCVTGTTQCTDFPTAGPYDATLGGGNDAFVTKLSSATGALIWSTYLGGAGDDYGAAVAVDSDGTVVALGTTSSTDFPFQGGFDAALAGSGDLFVTRLSASGNAIVWSTYMGGSANESAGRAAIGPGHDVFVTGSTGSSDFPVTGGFDTTHGGSWDAVVARISAGGSTLRWSSFLGDSASDIGNGLAVTESGIVYVAGQTQSAAFPVAGGFDSTLGGSEDAFVVKIDGAGFPATLVWSSYLGGSSGDAARAVAVDGMGGVFLTGDTSSTDFPVPGGFSTTNSGAPDAFVAKVADGGATASLAWASFLGGTSLEAGHDIAVDAEGYVYVTGTTYSANGFELAEAMDATLGGNCDAFVAKVHPSGTPLVWSTYLGGTGEDQGYAISVDSAGFILVAGYSFSGDFPGQGGFDTTPAGTFDAFAMRISPWPSPPCDDGGHHCGALGLEMMIPIVLAWIRLRRRP